MQRAVGNAYAWAVMVAATLFFWAPFLASFGIDESTLIHRLGSGALVVPPEIFQYDVTGLKLKVPFFAGYYWLAQHFSFSPHLYTWIFWPLTFLAAVLGVGFLAESFGVRPRSSRLAALLLVIAFPFATLSFGYHFKVGSASVSSGLIATALTVLLLGLARRGSRYAHDAVLLLLFLVHPLNSFIYLSLASLVHLFVEKKVSLRLAFYLCLVAAYFVAEVVSRSRGGTVDGGLLFNLILLVNGQGAAGAYFLPWENAKIVAKEFGVLLPALATLPFLRKRFGFDSRSVRFVAAVFAFLGLSLLAHYVGAKLEIATVTAADLSRVFASGRVVVATLFLALLFVQWDQGKRWEALVGALFLFFYSSVSVYLFFLLPLWLLLEKDLHRRALLLALAVFILGFTFLMPIFREGWRAIPFGEVFVQNRLVFLLTAVAGVFGVGIRWRAHALGGAFGLLCLLNLGTAWAGRMDAQRTQSRELEPVRAFFEARDDKDALILTEDEKFALGLEYRPCLLTAHLISYGIYGGDLGKLEREMDTVWQVGLRDRGEVNEFNGRQAERSGLSGYLRQRFLALTRSDALAIRERYGKLKYLVVSTEERAKFEAEMRDRLVLDGAVRVYELEP